MRERYWGKTSLSKYTPFLSIEASSRCMLHCPECITGCGELTRAQGDMSFNDFKQIIDEVAPYTIILNLYMQGEPYLNRSLGAMIKYAKEKRIFVSLSTNAQRCPQWDIDTLPHHLIVSADGATQASYEKYRVGGSLEKVLNFTQSLKTFKRSKQLHLPYVELQFLENRYNRTEAKATKALFKGQYNRFVKKTMQIIHPQEGAHFLPPKGTKHRYIKAQKHTASCYKMLSTTVVTQDGQVVPCCMDKNATYAYGYSQHASIAALNQNTANAKFHQQLITQKKSIGMCRNCPFA